MAEVKQGCWEYGPCPLCRNRAAGRLAYRFHPSHTNLHRFTLPPVDVHLQVVQCRNCGLHYLYPRVTQVAVESIYRTDLYFQGAAGGGYDDYRGQEVALRRTFRRFLKVLQRLDLTGGAVADIGCGLGYFLDEARSFFQIRMGTDLCADVAGQASATCDRVVCGGPDELLLTGNRFDLVISIGVLEHVYDPVSFLTSCVNLTREHGAVVVVTPDMNGAWRRCMGRRWPSFIMPEHIAYYDQQTLASLASEADMDLCTVFPYHQAVSLRLILKKLGWDVRRKSPLLEKSLLLPRVMMAGVFRKRNENGSALALAKAPQTHLPCKDQGH